MSIYRRDANGNERIAIILVDSAGNSVSTGNPLGHPNSTYKNSNGEEFLLVIAYDEDGNEQ